MSNKDSYKNYQVSSRLLDYSLTRVIALVVLGTDKNEIALMCISPLDGVNEYHCMDIASAVLTEMRVK